MYKFGFEISYAHLGDYRLEALKILKFLLDNQGGQPAYRTDELGKVVGLQGRELSGILSSFSKRTDTDPFVIKVGRMATNWSDTKSEKVVQLWALNPSLSANQIEELKNILEKLPLQLHSHV